MNSNTSVHDSVELSCAELSDRLQLEMLPLHMQDGMRRYIFDGIEPGSFGMAVLCNDLVGAFGAADLANRVAMESWANWLYNFCPSAARGSRATVAEWVAAGGWRKMTREMYEDKYRDELPGEPTGRYADDEGDD